MSTEQSSGSGSGNGQYQGSEAFANIVLAQNESVNPNTGTLNFFKTIIKLRGKRDSINFSLDLTYTPGAAGTFGLPIGWGLKLPYIDGPSVVVGGRTYAIDYGWQDAKNHKSGLRYLNDHGVKFELKNPALRLPSGKPGEYTYRLVHGDGSVDYFDASGKIREHDDLFGNSIYYKYISGGSGPQNLLLDFIEDSWNQKIQFKHSPGSRLVVVAPDGGTTTINLIPQGVRSIVDPVGLTTRFSYNPSPVGGNDILTEINYASGLVSKFSYDRAEYRDIGGSSHYLPRVMSHRHQEQPGTILARTDYRYGSLSSGSTFTGAAVGCRLGGSRDNLVDGSKQYLNYRYDVKKMRLDEAGKQLGATISWYNHMHLLMCQIDQLPDKTGSLTDVFRTDFEYNISADEHARSPSYSKPILMTRSRYTGSEYQPMTRLSVTYNEFGNVLASQDDLYVPGAGYIGQQASSVAYTPTKWNNQQDNQMPSFETVKDLVSGLEKHMQYTLSNDQKSIQKTVTSFTSPTAPSPIAQQDWKTQQYEYDQYGRMIVNTISWTVKPDLLPKETPLSSTIRSGYAFNDGILTETTINAVGDTSIIKYDMRKMSGPAICKVKPLGQTETFEYDQLGRLCKHIDFLGQQTLTINPSVDAKNVMKVSDFLGYTILTTFDGLGRTIRTVDNGDPTSSSMDPSRVLGQTTFDCLSNPKEVIDKFGLKTKYMADALGRRLQITTPDGNVTDLEYDDAKGTVTESINHDIRAISYLDGRSRVTRRVQYPDSDDSMSGPLEMATTYNGNNKATYETLSQLTRTGSTPPTVLKQVLTSYDPDSAIVTKKEEATGLAGQDSVNRQYTLDLFGNRHTYVKKTTYADGRAFTNNGPLLAYDQANRFVALQNQIGHKESHEYNPNGWLVRTTRFDGTKITYEYDAAGQVTNISSPTISTSLKYICVGRKARSAQGNQTMDYEYSRDGTLQSIQHEDGSKQMYELDKCSRIISDIDRLGVVRKIVFDEKGRVSSRSCQQDTYRYSYGRFNHTESQLAQVELSGAGKYRRDFSYDSFGRLKQETYTAPDSTVLLDTIYTMDAKQQLSAMHSRSTVSALLNFDREFSYDGIGQLVQDSMSSSVKKFVYDGNSNVISVSSDGQTKQMTYNMIDQRAEKGFEYDKNGRMIKDNSDNQYTFDDQDRLLSVQSPSGDRSSFGYQPDNLLTQHETAAKKSTLYYNDHQNVNAMQITDSSGHKESTSLFAGNDRLIAGYSDSAKSTYLLDQRGSTAMLLYDDQHTGSIYDAYGLAKSSSSSAAPMSSMSARCCSSFKFQQEYHDESQGLMYLRARFYDPNQIAFISMDHALMENRYAYCSGDPINLIDASGNSWTAYVLSMSIGVVVGVVVGAVTTPFIGPASAGLTVMAAGMVSGAIGNVAAGFVAAQVDEQGYGLVEIGRDFAVGAAGGLVGSGAGAATAMALSRSTSAIIRSGSTLIGMAVGTGSGAAVGTITEDFLEGEGIDWANAAVNASIGIVFGAMMGSAASRAPKGSTGFQNTLRSKNGLGLSRSRLSTASSMRDFQAPRSGQAEQPRGMSWIAFFAVLTAFCKPNPNLLRDFDRDNDSNQGPSISIPLMPRART